MQRSLHCSQRRNVTFLHGLRHFWLPAPLSLLVTVNVVRQSSFHKQELYHPRDLLWILAAIPGFRNKTGLPVFSWSSFFIWFLDFWLAWVTGLPVLSFQHTWHKHWMESIPLRSSLALVSLSLDTVVVDEVDELEENVGWSISCLEGVIDVEEWELDEEIDDKPGTTIGTKVLRVAMYSNTVLNEMVFLTVDPPLRISVFIAKLSERWNCWCILGDFIVKNISNSLTWTVASSCVCTSPLAVMTTVGLHDFVKISISSEFNSFLLIIYINAPESTTNSRSSS